MVEYNELWVLEVVLEEGRCQPAGRQGRGQGEWTGEQHHEQWHGGQGGHEYENRHVWHEHGQGQGQGQGW